MITRPATPDDERPVEMPQLRASNVPDFPDDCPDCGETHCFEFECLSVEREAVDADPPDEWWKR